MPPRLLSLRAQRPVPRSSCCMPLTNAARQTPRPTAPTHSFFERFLCLMHRAAGHDPTAPYGRPPTRPNRRDPWLLRRLSRAHPAWPRFAGDGRSRGGMRRWLHLKLEDETDQWSPPGIERIGGTLAIGEGEGERRSGAKRIFLTRSWLGASVLCLCGLPRMQMW